MRVRYLIRARAPAFMISTCCCSWRRRRVALSMPKTPKAGGPTASAPGAEVYFVDLKDGATVPAKLTIHFGLRNMGVGPAGLDRQHTGHHHLLIDTDLPPLDQPIPNDFNHLHYGAGQTEAEITLSPGEHTLQLLLGDKDHIPHTPPVMSARIRVRVADATPAPTAAGTGGPTLRRRAPRCISSISRTERPLRPRRPSNSGCGTWRSRRPAAQTRALRPPSSADRHRIAAARPADSERLQSSALRRRPDRGGDHALAGRAHVATAAGGQGPHPAYAAGHVGAHSREGRRRHAGPDAAATGGPTPSAPGAEVYFVDLRDGATVPPKTHRLFRAAEHGRRPGRLATRHSGHHHLLIDTDLPPLDQPIPNDFNHLHFGAGQTEAEITLTPGEHTLQLLLGDKDHIPHTPPVMSPRIRVKVADAAPAPTRCDRGPHGFGAGRRGLFRRSQGRSDRSAPRRPSISGCGTWRWRRPARRREHSGHHHLLIDTELPPLDQPIPNDFNHLHFGAGQTEAEITLSPGEHTLQLLLGDKDHIPHSPPVMSSRIRVNVGQAPAARKPSPPGARVYFVGLRNWSVVPAAATIRFGLVNMGVAPAGFEKAHTGHHHLLIDTPVPPLDQPIPSDFNHLHFGAGQTEAQVNLPLGVHTIQLLLGDESHVPHDPPVMSKPIKVVVTRTGKRRR